MAANTKTQYKVDGDTSDHRDDYSTTKVPFEGHFAVGFYRNEKGAYARECTIGGGDSETRDIPSFSHLVADLGQTRRNVMAQHVSIRFDSKSGMIAIVPLSKDHPVVVFKGTGIKTIQLEEKHLVEDLMTLFAVGEEEYIFHLHELNKKDIELFLRLRAHVFYQSGLAQPDARIQALPTRQPFNRIGSTLIHRRIARGRWADIWSGVHLGTGEVVAVKEMVITEAAHRDFLDEEVKINLNFPVRFTAPSYHRGY